MILYRNESKEAPLFKITSGLGAVLALALMTAPAFAQGGPSYEGRGYGGPLYVGPNFHLGGQYSAPIYGSPSYRARSSGEYRRQRSVTRSSRDTREATPKTKASESKPALTETATTENSSVAVPPADNPEPAIKPRDSRPVEKATASPENSSIAQKDTKAEAADTSHVNCTKYFPAVGMTVSVPCDKQ
jgi:hypothetical protein